MDHKAPEAFRTISEVAEELDIPQHVLRFWETRFRDIRPMKRGGGRRYYRPDDVDLLRGIRHLLYGEGYTIRGVQRILSEEGVKFVQAVWRTGAPQPPHRAATEDEGSDEAAQETEPQAAERRGLRGRLTALIGRDLDEREAEERQEPPMTAAPMPRVAPADRIGPAPLPDPSPRATAPAPAAAVPAAPTGDAAQQPPSRPMLSREDLRKLQAALHELGECRKLLAAAGAEPG